MKDAHCPLLDSQNKTTRLYTNMPTAQTEGVTSGQIATCDTSMLDSRELPDNVAIRQIDN